MPTDEITIDDLVNWYCEENGIVLWRDIPGFERLYQISNVGGLVKSLDSYVKHFKGGSRIRKGRMMRQPLNHCGYNKINLCKDGKRYYYQTHVLVARAWVPNPYNYPQVNHIDECKTNNNAANLEWCDASYNCNFGTRNKRISDYKQNKNAFNRQPMMVQQLTIDGIVVAEYSSINEVQRMTGLSESDISKCCRGLKRQSVGGYKWRYKKG